MNHPAQTVDVERRITRGASDAYAEMVRQELITFITGDGFSCVGGKSAHLQGGLVHRHFGPLADPAHVERLHGELARFAGAKDDIHRLLATFVATFDGPHDLTEEDFERLLWRQLQQMHDRDAGRHPWSSMVDPDPRSARFGFSIGGHPFFVVGLHPNSSRYSRRFAYPALAFNSHVQFERMKSSGAYGRIQQAVRAAELRLQGSVNPSIADFGQRSEAPQYSGRLVGDDWRCPFTPRVAVTAAPEPGQAGS